MSDDNRQSEAIATVQQMERELRRLQAEESRLRQAEALLRRVRPMWDADAPEICDLIDAFFAGQAMPTDLTSDLRTDDDIRALWRAAGGEFHGPIVEHGSIKEADLLPFLRRLTAGQVSPPAGLPPPAQPRTGDALPGAPSRAAMRSVEDGLRRQLAQRRVRRAAP